MLHRLLPRPASTALLLLLALSLTGCVSVGSFSSANVTNVELAEANYEVVATNVQGRASAGYILGFSGGFGLSQMQTLALVRVDGPGALYGAALQNLWDNFRAQYGEVEGRNLALVNVRFDSDAVNAIVYTRPQITIRADVVEFTN